MNDTTETQQPEKQHMMSSLPSVATDNSPLSVFSTGRSFTVAMEMAKMLSESTMVPDQYQAYNLKNGQWVHNPVGVGNCLVALEIASRMNLSPFTIMQNMDVVKGKPGFRGKFKAGLVNHSPLFSRLKYEWRSEPGKSDYGCRAYATEHETGEVLLGTWVDWAMVLGEEWNKNKKWTTMRDQMFQYRAASFWLDANAPDLTLGLPTVEEIEDVQIIDERTTSRKRSRAADVNQRLASAATEEPGTTEPDSMPDNEVQADAESAARTDIDAGDEVSGVDDTVRDDDLPFARDTEMDREVEAGDAREPLEQEFEEPERAERIREDRDTRHTPDNEPAEGGTDSFSFDVE